MKYRVAELEGALLDAAVAMVEGVDVVRRPWGIAEVHPNCDDEAAERLDDYCPATRTGYTAYSPSTDWGRGGPIIERNDWVLPYRSPGRRLHLGRYTAQTPGGFEHSGPTPLVAAMRAYVASRFGEDVELPSPRVSATNPQSRVLKPRHC